MWGTSSLATAELEHGTESFSARLNFVSTSSSCPATITHIRVVASCYKDDVGQTLMVVDLNDPWAFISIIVRGKWHDKCAPFDRLLSCLIIGNSMSFAHTPLALLIRPEAWTQNRSCKEQKDQMFEAQFLFYWAKPKTSTRYTHESAI